MPNRFVGARTRPGRRQNPSAGRYALSDAEETRTVAAAASLEPVSPELALVDAPFAARLRASLGVPARQTAESTSPRREHNESVEPVEFESTVSVDEIDPIADLIMHSPESALVGPKRAVAREHDPGLYPLVQETGRHADQSGYPTLPSPAECDSEQQDATETVLREIRDRIATPAAGRRRRLFRRRFTVASGLSAAIALAFLATNVGYGVA